MIVRSCDSLQLKYNRPFQMFRNLGMYLWSSNQRLMHHFSCTKLHCLINNPTRFVARGRHSQGVPSSYCFQTYLICWKIPQLRRNSLRMAPTSAERVRLLVQECNLVHEKWCIESWCEEDRQLGTKCTVKARG